MTDKLSGEELLEEFQRMFTRWGGLVGKEMQAYEQIKSLLTPIPEDKLTELINTWAETMSPEPNQDEHYRRGLRQAFKEYDSLREGKEEG